MQIHIPDSLSSRLRQLSAQRKQSVEKIVTDRLFTSLDDELAGLPTAEQAELRALYYLSDDALRAIAAEQMSSSNQKLLAQLMERNSRGKLGKEEQNILEALVERGDQLMLRKAEASAILIQRGYTGSAANLMNPNG
jgi:hypothetical protein